MNIFLRKFANIKSMRKIADFETFLQDKLFLNPYYYPEKEKIPEAKQVDNISIGPNGLSLQDKNSRLLNINALQGKPENQYYNIDPDTVLKSFTV